jgi:hypothetical protein
MQELSSIDLNGLNNSKVNIRYKSAGKCVLTLGVPKKIKIKKNIENIEKNMKKCMNNECRQTFDKNYAWYRAERVYVIDIRDKFTGEQKEKVPSDYNYLLKYYGTKKFYYVRNKWAIAKNYEEDIDIVDAQGIHYFMNWEQSFYHNLDVYGPVGKIFDETTNKYSEIFGYTGEKKYWFADGRFHMITIHVNGKQTGRYRSWGWNENTGNFELLLDERSY